MKSYTALALLCALAAQPISSAPQQSSIPNYSASQSGKLENLDENPMSSPAVINGPVQPSKPANFHKSQHFVTNDGKGEATFKAGQSITDNGFTKYAEHQLNYDSNANHKPDPNTQVLTVEEFQRKQKELQEQVDDFMKDFKPPSLPRLDFNNPQQPGFFGNPLNFSDFGSQSFLGFDENLKKMHQQFQEFAEQRRQEFDARFKAITEQQAQQQREFEARFGIDKGFPGLDQQLQQMRTSNRYLRHASSEHQTQAHLDEQVKKITEMANKLVQKHDCSEDSASSDPASSLSKLIEKLGQVESAAHVTSQMSSEIAKVKGLLSANTNHANKCGNAINQLSTEVDHLLKDLA
ncbi:hypothetical protein QAD02_022271 [Eretmocerus hayati]|uniref:Uncharacterized protein n=1 Tax=Eretmocerus hayati TaxID=131215 RepID=A0ACC2PST2_9HYME|nr:hypothetical protein QAD02_022271 [Eretmocerus hayati]